MALKLLCCLLLVVLVSAKVRYDNYKVLRVVPETDSHVELLRKMEEESEGLSFWTSATGPYHSVDIMVPPELLEDFYKVANEMDLKTEVFIEDVQVAIDNERPPISAKASFDWNNYYNLDRLYEWLQSLPRSYPRIAETFVAGRTYEGRQILGVKVAYKQGNPKIFLESGIHAREWVATATATWILNELLTSRNSDVRSIAENFEWYIVPSANPDGYVYSHTTDRMWRKTRTPGSRCFGVDPNRNWDDRWNQGGASSDPCSQTYPGTGPFSVIETSSLAGTIRQINPKIYFDFHSYSQLLMFPFGHRFETANNYNELLSLSNQAVRALASRYGTQYRVGSIVNAIYTATGGSIDWTKSKLNVPYPFVWELRDTGRHGFLLPANQIIPTSQETLDSIISLLNNIP